MGCGKLFWREDISILLDRSRFAAADRISEPNRKYYPRKVSDFAVTMFSDLYTQERVAQLRIPVC